METKTFPAKIDLLHEMILWISGYLDKTDCTQQIVRQIELAFEEAVVNIISHGYRHKKGDIELSFQSFPDRKIEITIKDEGPLFNPLLKTDEVDTTKSLEEREEGGLGIVLMRQYTDEIHYQRVNKSNILRLVKYY